MERFTETEIVSHSEDVEVSVDLHYNEGIVHVSFTGFGAHPELVLAAIQELASRESMEQLIESMSGEND